MQINWTEERNLTMLTDYYEFTMSNGYFLNGMKDKIAVFDMFFRNIPDGGGLPSLQDWSSWSIIWTTCALPSRTSTISEAKRCSMNGS